jgi:hypothetical protein
MFKPQMSNEVRGFTEDWLEAMGKSDWLSETLPFFSRDTVITMTCDLPFCGKHTGISGAMELSAKMRKTIAIETQRSEIVTASETQYSAIAKTYMTGQCRETGEALDLELVHLVDFTIAGKIKTVHCFPKDQEALRTACLSVAEKKFWKLADALFSIEVLHDGHPMMDLISPDAEFHVKVSPSSLLSRDSYTGHSGFLQLMAESQRTKWMMMKAKPMLFMMTKSLPQEILVLHSDDDNVYVMMAKGDFIVYSHMVFGEKMLKSEEIHLPRTVKPWDIHKYPKMPMDQWNLGGTIARISGHTEMRTQQDSSQWRMGL